MLLSVQLGLTEEGEALFNSIKPILLSLLLDPSASVAARTQVLYAIYRHVLSCQSKHLLLAVTLLTCGDEFL